MTGAGSERQKDTPLTTGPAPSSSLMGPRERYRLERLLGQFEKKRKELETQLSEVEARIAFEDLKRRALSDFYFFVTEIMGFRDLYEPLHRPLCELISDPRIVRQLILLPRGHFKTTIISICYPLWLLCQDQNRRIALCSKAGNKSEENLLELTDRAARPEFQGLFGQEIGDPSGWPINRKDTIRIKRRGATTGPSISAYSTESSEVGRHFDFMLLDDIVDQESVNSSASREKIWQWFARQLSVLDPGCKLIVVGTRWAWDDPYSRIMKQFTRYEESTDLGWWVEKRAAIENGKIIFPSRFTRAILDEIKEAQGDYVYSCFYMNDPSPEGVNPFDIRKLNWVDYDPEDKENDGDWTYILIDPASTRESWSSYTGIIIGSARPTRKFLIREAFLEKMHPDALVDKIFQLVDKFKPFRVIIEDEAYQKSLYYWCRRDMLQRGVSFRIDLVKNPRNVSHEARLISLQPFLHNGAIEFANDMPGREDLIEELETFPKGPHHDLLAALYFATRIVFPPIIEVHEKPDEVPVRSRLLMEMMTRRPARRAMPRVRFRSLGDDRWAKDRSNGRRKSAGA